MPSESDSLFDAISDEIYNYEPRRRYRWVLLNTGLDHLMLCKLRFVLEDGSLTLEAYSSIGNDVIISNCPVLPHSSLDHSRANKTVLMFPDRNGTIIDSYLLMWEGVDFIPIVELNYDSSEPVQQCVRFRNIALVKLED